MSRVRITQRETPRAAQLRDQLQQEFDHPQPGQQEPLIISEESRGFGINPSQHLYVVWSEWADLDRQTRSEVIMNAYAASQEGQDPNNLLNITLAMGLTPMEAQQLGIQVEP